MSVAQSKQNEPLWNQPAYYDTTPQHKIRFPSTLEDLTLSLLHHKRMTFLQIPLLPKFKTTLNLFLLRYHGTRQTV